MLRLSVLAIVLITGASFLRAAPPGETARFAHKGAIHALALSKDGQQLLTASADKWAYALDAKTLAPVKRFGPHNSEVTGVAGLKDKSVIVSTLEDRQDKHSLMVWDWDNQRVKAVVDDSEMSLFNVAVAPNESILAVSMGNEDGRLYGVPPAGGRLGIDLRNPKWLCKVMRFSPDGRWMAMGSGGGIHCWEIGEKAKPVGDGASDTDGTINGIAWLPNSEQFVTAHVDGILRLWRVKDLTVIGRFPKHAGETQCVAISADGKLLAAGSSDGGLNIYTVATQKLGKQLPHDKAVTAVEFVTSDVVATGTADGIVRLLNLSGDTTVKPMVKPPLATQ